MAKFYGTVEGGKGTATRMGSNRICTYAASWKGAVRTTMYTDPNTNAEHCTIEAVQWKGVGSYKLIYDGPWPMVKEGH